MAHVCGLTCIQQDYGKEPLPTTYIYDLIDQSEDEKYVTKLELRSGYHKIIIVEGDIWKATFKTKQGFS